MPRRTYTPGPGESDSTGWTPQQPNRPLDPNNGVARDEVGTDAEIAEGEADKKDPLLP